jgi:hypothetical protein
LEGGGIYLEEAMYLFLAKYAATRGSVEEDMSGWLCFRKKVGFPTIRGRGGSVRNKKRCRDVCVPRQG